MSHNDSISDQLNRIEKSLTELKLDIATQNTWNALGWGSGWGPHLYSRPWTSAQPWSYRTPSNNPNCSNTSKAKTEPEHPESIQETQLETLIGFTRNILEVLKDINKSAVGGRLDRQEKIDDLLAEFNLIYGNPEATDKPAGTIKGNATTLPNWERVGPPPSGLQSASDFIEQQTRVPPQPLCPACKAPLSSGLVKRMETEDVPGKCPQCLALFERDEIQYA